MATGYVHGFPAVRPSQAAKLLGVGLTTLYKLRKRPDFPRAIPITDRAFCFAVADLEAWMMARKA